MEIKDYLPGELMVSRAQRAQLVVFFPERGEGHTPRVTGNLMCTNYRLCFLPEPESALKLAKSDEWNLLNCRNVPLGLISEMNMFAGGKRKVVDGRTTLPKKVVEFEVICKDLRRFIFSVKHSPKNEASSMVNAIARHTNPSSVHLLFAFDYARGVRHSKEEAHDTAPSFLTPRDWKRELSRLNVTDDQWRVCEANKKFLLCDSLSPCIVCPTAINEGQLDSVASLHRHNRLPVWCWSHPHTGVSLTRGASSDIDDESEAPDPNYLYAVGMARHIDHQVESKRINRYDVTRHCGTIRDVRSAFAKMQELCIPMSAADLASLDRHWFPGLDVSGWPALVRSCLMEAKEVTHTLCVKRKCAMLLEQDGVDFSCVVSSLVQLMVDPHYRSVSGFEALVQKEWVALGHPFTLRHRLTIDALLSGEDEAPEAPVFLLFLDCVWQLTEQFPSAFEFSETYLLHLHEVVQSCLFGNFLFDSTKARVQASIHSRRTSFFAGADASLDQAEAQEDPLVSAWGRWRYRLDKEENERCLNPFYYVFGSGDAHYDYTASSPLPLPSQSIDVSLRRPSCTSLGVNEPCGIYRGPSPTSPLQSKDDVRDFYQLGLLMPETSMCSVRIWAGFFFRAIPGVRAADDQRLIVQGIKSRMVRDVRKLKDELNELELQGGSFATDLTSFIGEVLQEREKQQSVRRKVSVDASVPMRPRLSAVVYDYAALEEARGENGGSAGAGVMIPLQPLLPKVKTFPDRVSTLAQFTDALYSSEHEVGGATKPRDLMERSHSIPNSSLSSPPGRSPVSRTKLRVTRTEAADPVQLSLRWQGSGGGERHSPLVANKILSRKDSGVLEEGLSDELTEL